METNPVLFFIENFFLRKKDKLLAKNSTIFPKTQGCENSTIAQKTPIKNPCKFFQSCRKLRNLPEETEKTSRNLKLVSAAEMGNASVKVSAFHPVSLFSWNTV